MDLLNLLSIQIYKMSTLNAGRTIDHSSKGARIMISIPSYQHGKPYMLPEKRKPASINLKRQQLLTLTLTNTSNYMKIDKPSSVEQHSENLNYAIRMIDEKMKH